MRVDPSLVAVDLLPENEDGVVVSHPLPGSERGWGAVLTAPFDGLRERNTRSLFKLGYAEDGHLAGLWLNHAKVDSDGHEYHEVFLPIGREDNEPERWTCHNPEPERLMIVEPIECPCGLRGTIHDGQWEDLS